MISIIAYARRHTEISGIKINMRADNQSASDKWNNLYKQLSKLNGYNI